MWCLCVHGLFLANVNEVEILLKKKYLELTFPIVFVSILVSKRLFLVHGLFVHVLGRFAIVLINGV